MDTPGSVGGQGLSAAQPAEFPIDGVVKAVLDRLAQKDAGSPDLYVWSDGTVSNQQTTDVPDRRLVALFTPGPGSEPTAQDVRRSVVAGLEAVHSRHPGDGEASDAPAS